jgi:hypothetical protein
VEDVLALLGKAHVDVARRAGERVIPLGHEGDRLAAEVRDLLDGVLHDHVPIGHGQGIGIADVELLLARPPFALAVLDGDA